MKKLFLVGFLLLFYGIGMAQDTIVPKNNQNQKIAPTPSSIQNQQQTPVIPKAPDQPVAPVTNNPTKSNVPNQTGVPVQSVTPNQPTQTNQPPVTVQPTVPVESQVQTNVPEQQNVPLQSNVNPSKQQNGYQTMAQEPRIGGKVVRFTFIASPQVTWMTSNSRQISNSKSKFGFAYGVEGDIFLASERYSVLTGMVISSLGGTLNYKEQILFSGVTLPANTKVEYFLRSRAFCP